MTTRDETHGGAIMRKDRNQSSTESDLSMNMFPLHSRFREKEKENDLAAVNINHFHFYSVSTNKIYIASVFSRDQFKLVRGCASPAVGHVRFDQGTPTHNRRGLLLLKLFGDWWYGCARGKQAIVPTKGGARMIRGRRFSLSKLI